MLSLRSSSEVSSLSTRIIIYSMAGYGIRILYQRDIVPGDPVNFTGDFGHSVGDADDGDEYESSSSTDEEEFQQDESPITSYFE